MCLLSLVCVWTEFHHIKFKIRADIILKWLSDKNFIHTWLKAVAEKYSVQVKISEKTDKTEQLALICCESLKLHILLQLLTDKNIYDQKKIAVWCQYSVIQLLIYSVLQLTDVDEHLFSASITEFQCQKTITVFNKMSQKAIMFIDSYMIESCDLNLQKCCWNVILFNVLLSILMTLQTVRQFCQLSYSSEIVNVVKIYTQKTFNVWITELNIRKAILTVMTELNKQLFKDQNKSVNSDISDKDVDLDDWVLNAEKLISADSSEVLERQLSVLKSEQLLCHIIDQQKSQYLIIHWQWWSLHWMT